MEFKGKVVAITGAAGGIGQALCRYFGARGRDDRGARQERDGRRASPTTLGRDGINADAAVARHRRSETRCAPGFAELAAALGPVDILINNAGFSGMPTLELTAPATGAGDVEGNLNGAYYCAHAVLPAMKARRAGAIVNIGSVNGLGALGDPAYSAAKAGMISLTRSLAMEYGRFGIRANIVLPGTVRTPIWEERRRQATRRCWSSWRAGIRSAASSSRSMWRAPSAFLASDAAAAITGVVLPVDCGLTAGNIVMARELTLEDF